jgi:hypothetical protein
MEMGEVEILVVVIVMVELGIREMGHLPVYISINNLQKIELYKYVIKI